MFWTFRLCYSCKKIKSTNSMIQQVNNDKKVSKYSQLSTNCGITTNELMNQTELCKATPSFTCSTCSFKCCSRNNFEYHMQNHHKISMKCSVISYSKEMEISESMNHLSIERSSHTFSKRERRRFEGFRKVK